MSLWESGWIKQQKNRLSRTEGRREGSDWGNGPCAYFILPLSLSFFHFISINRQTLGSWGVVHAEQMHPLAVSLHSPHNEPDGARTDHHRHFHSPPGRRQGPRVAMEMWLLGPGRLADSDLSALISVLFSAFFLILSFSFSSIKARGGESSVLHSSSVHAVSDVMESVRVSLSHPSSSANIFQTSEPLNAQLQ